MGTIAEKLSKLESTKSEIKNAIIEKGQNVGNVFSTYPDAIRSIETGTDTSDATALASDILSGKMAYGSSGKITGTIPSQSATTITPGTSAKTAIPAGTYAAGAATVAGDANLVAGNIKEGVSIFGVAGSFAGGGGETVSVSIEIPAMPIEYNVYYCDGGETYNHEYLVMSGKSVSVLKNTLVFISASSDFVTSATTSGGVSNISYPGLSKLYQLFFVSDAGTISF